MSVEQERLFASHQTTNIEIGAGNHSLCSAQKHLNPAIVLTCFLSRTNWKGPCGDQSAGASQKKRIAVVRTESVETKEYESCQQNDVEVDRDESLKKLSFVPGAVSDSAGWREPHWVTVQERA